MTLDGLNSFIQSLPRELTVKATADIAEAVHRALNITIRAHQTPFGVPWAPRKRGTRPVLNNAVDAVSHTSVGSRVYISVRGINARHHKGAVRGSVQRQIILYKKHGAKAITPRIAAAIRDVLAAHLELARLKAANA